MPRLYRRKARTDRYKIGRITHNVCNKQGYSINFGLPSLLTEDTLICKKGETYYTWHPKGGNWQFSAKEPDLRSEWERTFDDFSNRVGSAIMMDSDLDEKEDLKNEIEEYRDQLTDNLNNMPDALQESSVLNERIEELDSLIEQLED
jgi:hypothetical protein